METLLPQIIEGGVTIVGSVLGFIGVVYVQRKKSVDAHIETQKAFQKEIYDKLDEHRKEYLAEIENVKDELTDMRAQTQQWQSNYEIKFNNLVDKVNRHNNFMERLATAEKDIAVLQNREKVSENRLKDLEYAKD